MGKNMKVWHKIIVAPAVAMGFLALLGGVAYWALSLQQRALQDVYTNRFASYQAASQASESFAELHSDVYRLFTGIAKMQPDKINETSTVQKRNILALQERMSKLAQRQGVREDERTLTEGVSRRLTQYAQHVEHAIDLSQVDAASGLTALERSDAAFQATIKDLAGIVTIEKKLAEAAYDSAARAYARVLYALVGIVVLALLGSAAVAAFMSRLIVRPLAGATGLASRIAKGDLTGNIHSEGRDETGQLVTALKEMNENLRRIVENVRSSADAIGSGTRQIASGNADLSQRTEEQASSLEETASSIEQLTSTVKQNAENARQANQLAIGASEVALKGGQVVSEVVGTMSSINESSRKIVDIISVIDGIAFQTNILALNAAVEAARAGEQGRGFAVVATEVRNLAQRSAAAAKEIKVLIGDSVDKVGAGTRLVDAAGKTMEEIVHAVKRVTDIMAEITAASQEQSSGIEEVNRVVTQMDEVTQQNAALVEQAAAAAHTLQEQARTLEEAVAAFDLGKQPSVPLRSADVLKLPVLRGARPEARKGEESPKGSSPAAVESRPPRLKAAGGEAGWEEF